MNTIYTNFIITDSTEVDKLISFLRTDKMGEFRLYDFMDKIYLPSSDYVKTRLIYSFESVKSNTHNVSIGSDKSIEDYLEIIENNGLEYAVKHADDKWFLSFESYANVRNDIVISDQYSIIKDDLIEFIKK